MTWRQKALAVKASEFEPKNPHKANCDSTSVILMLLREYPQKLISKLYWNTGLQRNKDPVQ